VWSSIDESCVANQYKLVPEKYHIAREYSSGNSALTGFVSWPSRAQGYKIESLSRLRLRVTLRHNPGRI